MKNILIVDDEARMLNLIELFLKPHGYSCLKTNNGHEAIQHLKKGEFDLLLLDIMMPEMSGWEVCEKIRTFSSIPIIMLTARDTKADLIRGLELGADDYLTKPFDEEVLLAKIKATLRRHKNEFPTSNSHLLTRGGFSLNYQSFTLIHNEKQISLTLKEFKLLEALMKKPEQVYTRQQLLLMVWDNHAATEIRTVDSHIRNLRDKLKSAHFPIENHLTTIWGFGYQWKV
ncbi:response regulator transcription factor [Rossellomorea sp. YZS02]|uniref:response regulator transcription factor n=1 Tax=Rossellomorea sp. YZS02 TaxID=3097358 RepID=UPI002A1119E5|nr:response regulator transcription factor [Rossellomorea sp. YZS02]MDX8345204.1 response regulator transcription factor [Rossellomorea sp. YZS02]